MKPKRIFLLRHGEAEGNVDKNIFKVKPDYATVLTNKGITQAKDIGREISTRLNGESKFLWKPQPSYRTAQSKVT